MAVPRSYANVSTCRHLPAKSTYPSTTSGNNYQGLRIGLRLWIDACPVLLYDRPIFIRTFATVHGKGALHLRPVIPPVCNRHRRERERSNLSVTGLLQRSVLRSDILSPLRNSGFMARFCEQRKGLIIETDHSWHGRPH